MKIEEGRFYRASNGDRVGPMLMLSAGIFADDAAKAYAVGHPGVWHVSGRAWCGTDHDLFAEWIESEPAPRDIKREIGEEAIRIVTGARRAAYGKPENNFERIARFWQAYFENTGRPEARITMADVSPLMRLMKEARLCESPDHRDSFVDIAGYALTGAEINLAPEQKKAVDGTP